MSTDFRVSVDFFTHHKTKKLIRRIGDAGVLALMRLWGYAAKHKPDGALLNMTVEDIEIAADWNGEDGVLVVALIEVGFIDESPCGVYELHDWRINNPWVFDAGQRSDESRLMRLAGVNRDAFEELSSRGVTGITREEYQIWKEYTQEDIVNDTLTTRRPHVDYTSTTRQLDVNFTLSPTPTPTPTPYPSLEPEPELRELNTSAVENSNTTPEEREMLHVLWKAQPFWLLDQEKDLAQVRALSVEFPHVDVLREVKAMTDWLKDKKRKSKSPRLFMRNWITRAAQNYKPNVRQLAEMDPDELVKEFYGGVKL